MTKKDYELIARAIAETRDYLLEEGGIGRDSDGALDRLSYVLAFHLRKANERFDRDRFLKAAGV